MAVNQITSLTPSELFHGLTPGYLADPDDYTPKKQTSLERLLAQKLELDHEINKLWQELRMLRMAAIRGDDDPGQLPPLVGLDELQRAGQEKTERRERANHAIDMSLQHQAGLRDLNSAA